jgi:hypothetical protein
MTRLVVDGASPEIPLLHVPLRLGRMDVVIDVDLDEHELHRRQQDRCGPILNLDLLNLLLAMPHSSTVGKEAVPDYDWRLLRIGARSGAVAITTVDGAIGAIRRASPPLSVQHVTVVATHWRNGLSIASRFAPYGSRELILDRLPADDVELRLEAGYLGIGISVRGDGPDTPASCIIEPAPFAPARYTGASWLFAERLFAQQGTRDV